MGWYVLLVLKVSTQIVMHSQNSLLHHPSLIPSPSSSFSPFAILFFLSYLCWPRLLGVVRFCHNHLGDWGPVPMAEESWVEERSKKRMRERESERGEAVKRWAVEDSLAWGGGGWGVTACLAQPRLMWGDSLGFALTTLAPPMPSRAGRRE